ncbi:MAG: hypothetical protein QOF83_1405 [Solirubrobacteraceae bacterium]|jgi:hypothetical protein|nr:hypothetical protein [Solirubrobacteraceae bacterium]
MRERDLQILHGILETRGGFGRSRAWLHFVAVHAQRWPADGFDDFLERNADLLDSQLIHHLYSRELLLSEPARASWTDPDLRRLPALAY